MNYSKARILRRVVLSGAVLFTAAALPAEEVKPPAAAPKAGTQKKAAETVEITGSRIKQNVTVTGRVTDASAPVVVIDREQIDRSGAATLSEMLRRHPGIR